MRASTTAWLAAILLFALAQGLVRAVAIPLWAHYDEPSHYEYVRFVIDHRRLPQIADRDFSILRRVAETDRTTVPCPEPPAAPSRSCVGPSGAFDEPPAYYLLQAAVLSAIRPRTIPAELRWTRSVSVLLWVGVVWLGFATVRVALPLDRPLALATAGLLAALPGLADLMSAVNNDVGATAAGSALVATLALCFRDGRRRGRLAMVAAAAVACALTKSTALVLLPLAIAGLWLALWPALPPRVRWGVPAVAVGAAIVATIGWVWPAEWQAHGPRPRAGRYATDAPVGRHVFGIWQEGEPAPTFWQPIDVDPRPGEEITLGAWVRTAGVSRLVPLPVLGTPDALPPGPRVVATPAWTFHRYTTRASADTEAWVLYLPEVDAGDAEYDGIVLATGGAFGQASPTFDDDTAAGGVWNGMRFVNLVKNGSAEAGQPAFRYWIERLLPAGGVNQRLASWLDWRRTWPAFQPALKWQFITFWAGYATGRADGPFWTRLLVAIVTTAAIAGLVLELASSARRRRVSGYEIRFLTFAAMSVLAIAAASLLRIDPVDPAGRILYIPTARYAYVAIVPAMILLARGWGAWWPAAQRGRALAALVAGVLIIGMYLSTTVQRRWYADLACRQTACGTP